MPVTPVTPPVMIGHENQQPIFENKDQVMK
jgi:hypothetical protein